LSPRQQKKFYLKKGDILDTYLEKTEKYLPQPPINPDDQYAWKRMQKDLYPEVNGGLGGVGDTLESLKKQKNSKESIKRID
jgi:hypothetical protein